MEKEFIPYEQALDLKELGFDEKCYGYYTKNQEYFYFDVDDLSSAYTKNMDNLVVNSIDGLECTAPLYQQAFRWFREKYKIHSSTFWMKIDKSIYWNYRYSYLDDKSTESVNRSIVYFISPEEAELECLKKLIELVKERQ